MQGEAKFMIYSIKEMSHLSNTGEFESKVIVVIYGCFNLYIKGENNLS
jgi:hypothetical protein